MNEHFNNNLLLQTFLFYVLTVHFLLFCFLVNLSSLSISIIFLAFMEQDFHAVALYPIKHF